MLAPEAIASQRSLRCSVAYALKRRKEKKKVIVLQSSNLMLNINTTEFPLVK
jgi:hypothetical protein